MLHELLVSGAFLLAPPERDLPELRTDEQVESAAALAASFRFEPFTGSLFAQEFGAGRLWSRTESAGAPVVRRIAFELDGATGRLRWRTLDGSRTAELILDGALALDGPNLLRLEVANLDSRATAELGRLRLEIDGRSRELRRLGREKQSRDLVTLWSPELGRGFRLTGEVEVRGAAETASRVFVELGVGRGRRVEVEIDGRGELRSEPPALARAGGRKVAVGYFDAELPVALVAEGERFELWRNGSDELRSRRLELEPGAGASFWLARFGPDPDAATEPHAARISPELVHFRSNTTPIDVPSGQPGLTIGPASPYPSTINVTGPLGGSVLDVDVELKGMFHEFVDDIDVLVVSPRGTAVLLMSDACGSSASTIDRTFDDEALLPLSDSISKDCGLAEVQPTNFGSGDTFDSPAPASGYQSALSAFDGENPNGTWSLFVMDDQSEDSGAFAGGWELALDLSGYQALIPGAGDSGPASPYPVVRTILPNNSQVFGPILDLDVALIGVSHQFPDDIDLLLVAPNGEVAMLVSDACGSAEIVGVDWEIDDEAPATLSDNGGIGCLSGSFQPTDFVTGESLPAPAPAAPYGVSLGLFDGDDPVGDWKLYARDDGGLDVGFVRALQVRFTTVGIFRDGFEGQTSCSWSDQVPPVICG